MAEKQIPKVGTPEYRAAVSDYFNPKPKSNPMALANGAAKIVQNQNPVDQSADAAGLEANRQANLGLDPQAAPAAPLAPQEPEMDHEAAIAYHQNELAKKQASGGPILNPDKVKQFNMYPKR